MEMIEHDCLFITDTYYSIVYTSVTVDVTLIPVIVISIA